MGIPTLIKTLTASGDSSLSFVHGSADVTLDGTYDEYMFVFTDIGPATGAEQFTFNGSTDSGSNYNVTKTTAFFTAKHLEGGSSAALAYDTAKDLAQATGFQALVEDLGNAADKSAAGTLCLFNPSNTTYVKHFYSRMNALHNDDASEDNFASGYFNTTSAINAVQFKMSSGDFDGVIQLYGIS